ncbi:outer membrane protein OmpU [Rhodobacter viridis]|uniref:Outer membrane protein OmpU n=1 Tax=Rhodobacter viridis TaxID=1054202 RepID=A0A318U184_9RHOB|nr:porin [Rhodobacter viridis]PYF11722.1 outer membrane protein OmpU [Rhodobacter viridis]
MKKLLIATTALVMTAGMASAEVKLSGDGRMGVVYDGADWNFSSRARVAFTLSGTTDSGLEFGASFKTSDIRGDAAGADGLEDPRAGNRGTVFISGAFGKLTMGDVASAPEELFGDLADVGYMGDDWGTANGGTNDIPYLTLDNETTSGLMYTYSAGSFSVAAAMTDGNGYGSALQGTFEADTQAYSVAAAYTFGNYTVGLGYEQLDRTGSVLDMSQTELAGIAKFGNTDVKAYYAIGGDANPVDDAVGLSVASTFNAITVKGYVQNVDYVAAGVDSVTWYGLGADYDLGGGAILAAGVQDDDINGSDPTANVGVKFKF